MDGSVGYEGVIYKMQPHSFDILYINLDRDFNKRSFITSFLQAFNCEVVRIEAQLGEEIGTPLKYIDINFKDPNKGRNLTYGELGCAVSHMMAWQYCKDNNKPVIILEDDIKSDYAPSQITKIFREAEKKIEECDLIYFGRQPLSNEFITEDKWVNPRYSWLAHAYMISPQGADKLLNDYYKRNIIPVDEWIPFLIGRGCDPYVKIKFSNHVEYGQLKALAYHDANFIYQNRQTDSLTETTPEIFVPEWKEATLNSAVVTIATDEHNIGFQYLRSSAEYYDIGYFHNIGQNVIWDGGDVATSPGGGHKVNLLKQFLSIDEFNEDDVILFLDGYDTYLFNSLGAIIQKWFENFNTDKVLFAAEKTCWPNKEIDELFEDTEFGYNYLNSGCFIGKVRALRKLLKEDIENIQDDQAYYQNIFLNTDLIELDSQCLIFQCVAGAMQDILYENNGVYIYNNATGTVPFVLHGNGGNEEKQVYLNLLEATDKDRNMGIYRRWTGPLQ